MQAGRADSRNRARDNRRYAADRPGDCKHCYFWKGKRKGCSQEECYYLLPKESPASVDVSEILCRRNLAEMAVAAVKDVHTAGIPHASVTV